MIRTANKCVSKELKQTKKSNSEENKWAESKKKEVWLKLWRELSDPGVLHFLKATAKSEEGMSKAVYKAETPGGEVCGHM